MCWKTVERISVVREKLKWGNFHAKEEVMAKEFLLFFALVLTSEIEAKKPKAGNLHAWTDFEMLLGSYGGFVPDLQGVFRHLQAFGTKAQPPLQEWCDHDFYWLRSKTMARARRVVSLHLLWLLSASVTNWRLQIWNLSRSVNPT